MKKAYLRRFKKTRLGLFGALALSTLASGCSSDGDNGPTSPEAEEFVLARAVVSVNGDAVNGQTLPLGHGEGGSTRFEAEMTSNGQQEPQATVWMEYDRPRRHGHRRHDGRVKLYDDGTHGDRVAGDGLFCLEDFQGDYGCHSANAGTGEYHYEFYGTHHDGQESNHMTVTVTIIDD